MIRIPRSIRHRTACLLMVAALMVVVLAVYVIVVHHRPPPPHHGQKGFVLLPYNQSSTESTRSPSKIRSEVKRGKTTEEIIIDNTTALLERAKEMHRQNGVVLFTMINDAFLDFAHSWCCNTASFDNVHQRVLFLTTDVQTAQRLKSVWANITVAAISSPEFLGPQLYSKAGYVRLMVERTRICLNLLEAGVQLLLFEVDSVWLKNPMPLLLARQSEGDVLATRVKGADLTAGGFLFLNPTAATIKCWQELTRMMDKLYSKIKTMKKFAAVSKAQNDQMFFSKLVRKKYAGIRIVYLPAETFPDGKWYRLPEKRRRKSRPFLINNNWIVGTEAKRQRAKAFGHWFWEESEGTCNSSTLLRMDI